MLLCVVYVYDDVRDDVCVYVCVSYVCCVCRMCVVNGMLYNMCARRLVCVCASVCVSCVCSVCCG